MNVIKRNHGQRKKIKYMQEVQKDKWRTSYIEWEKIWGEEKTKGQWLALLKNSFLSAAVGKTCTLRKAICSGCHESSTSDVTSVILLRSSHDCKAP